MGVSTKKFQGLILNNVCDASIDNTSIIISMVDSQILKFAQHYLWVWKLFIQFPAVTSPAWESWHKCTLNQVTSSLAHSHLGGPLLVLYGLHHPPSPVAPRRVAPPRPRSWRAELRCYLRTGNDADAVRCGGAKQQAGLCSFQTAQGVSSALRGRGCQLCRCSRNGPFEYLLYLQILLHERFVI